MKKKQSRILGLALIMGAVAALSASSIAQQLRRSSGNGHGPDSEVQVASMSGDSDAPGMQTNAAVKLLQIALNCKANALIDMALEQNQQVVVNRLVLANDYVMLTTQRPEQQKHTIEKVWQIKKWAPGSKEWAEVAKAPSLVKELTNVSPAVCAKIQAQVDKVWDELKSPLVEVESRLLKDDSFNKLSKQEQQMRVYNEMQKLPKKSTAQRGAWSVSLWANALNFARELLNPKQRAELDSFVKSHSEALTKATVGMKTPESILSIR